MLKIKAIAAAALSACLAATMLVPFPAAAQEAQNTVLADIQDEVTSTRDYETYRNLQQTQYGDAYRPAYAQPVTLPASQARSERKLPLVTNVGGKAEAVIMWTDSSTEESGDPLLWMEWDLPASATGLYEIAVEYYIPEVQTSHAVRGFEIDGSTPFSEASSLYFYQMFTDKHVPKTNWYGDEISPSQKTVPAWREQVLYDSLGLYSEPYRFCLEKGIHTFRLTFKNQGMYIAGVTLRPAYIPLSYNEILDEYTQEGYQPAKNSFEMEAEREIAYKNTPVIRMQSDSNPTCTPRNDDRVVMNIINGLLWRKGNEAITWCLNAPQTGLYKISMQVKQAWGDGLPSFRRIEIDGKVPFEEMLSYQFPYNRHWQTVTLSDASGEPYLFYLKKGHHTLTMHVKMEPVTPIIRSVRECIDITSAMILNIKMITGDSPDLNYEYRLENKIPGLMEDIAAVYAGTTSIAKSIAEISEKTPPAANAFAQVAADFKVILDDPDLITRKLADIENALETMGAWYNELQVQPLGMDSIMVTDPDAAIVNKKESFIDVLIITIKSFLRSFERDYNQVDMTGLKDDPKNEALTLWVGRGREWSQCLKELAEDGFTAETGINIKINTIPAGQLSTGSVNTILLAIAAGREPDIALGVAANLPVEFAIRNVVEPLGDYVKTTSIRDRFVDGILTPFIYKNDIYALPETMNFKALIYRKDLVDQLDLIIPDTWQDVYDHVLPTLYQNNLNFYMNTGDISPFLFQQGGTFYTEDGLYSALDTKEAFNAFKEWTALYTTQGVPVMANFYNRFRSGLIPMGVGGYSEYMSLIVAAPELVGRIGMAPIPGHVRNDGIVDRSSGGYADTAAVVFKSCANKKGAVDFLDWWTDTDTQTQYGKSLEAIVGTESRWNSANVNAFLAMPWTNEEKTVIRSSFEWVKEMPVILGGYYTSRHLTNAWNRVVLSKMDPRDSLEQAVIDINRELLMRREEAGRKANN